MKGKGFIQLLVSVILIAAIVFIAVCGIGADKLGSASDVRLGLDLAGGVSITYETVKEDTRNGFCRWCCFNAYY